MHSFRFSKSSRRFFSSRSSSRFCLLTDIAVTPASRKSRLYASYRIYKIMQKRSHSLLLPYQLRLSSLQFCLVLLHSIPIVFVYLPGPLPWRVYVSSPYFKKSFKSSKRRESTFHVFPFRLCCLRTNTCKSHRKRDHSKPRTRTSKLSFHKKTSFS